MSLEHTAAGLSNLHIFAKVDLVVFVEGGASQALEMVPTGSVGPVSADGLFWSNIYAVFATDLRIQVRPVGSKTTLVKIAEMIAGGLIQKVHVAMDRDFDGLFGKSIEAPGVFYTRGYSWENDVFTPAVTAEVAFVLCNTCRSEGVQAEINDSFERFYARMRGFVYADIVFYTCGVQFIPRRGGEMILRSSKSALPMLNIAKLRELLNRAKGEVVGKKASGVKFRCTPHQDCCGHVIANFAYHIISHLVRRHCRIRSIPKDVVTSIAIGQWRNGLQQNRGSEVYRHYEAQYGRATRA